MLTVWRQLGKRIGYLPRSNLFGGVANQIASDDAEGTGSAIAAVAQFPVELKIAINNLGVL
jgi:ABC-type protease/lipase transport system fused ATPase/permease subunit